MGAPFLRRLDRRSAVVLAAGCASACLCALGCGGESSGAETPPPVFSGAPALSVVSASGALGTAVRFSPEAPVVGLDAAELTITDASGAAVGGLTVVVVPWMPAHGHGSSTRPTVSEQAPGVYVATPINFFMPGEWELRTTLSGPIDDTVTPAVVVQ